MTDSTPRITAQYLEQFSHKNVRLVGKVIQLRGETAIVDAGGQITVLLNRVRFSPLSPQFSLLLSGKDSDVRRDGLDVNADEK